MDKIQSKWTQVKKTQVNTKKWTRQEEITTVQEQHKMKKQTNKQKGRQSYAIHYSILGLNHRQEMTQFKYSMVMMFNKYGSERTGPQ